MPVNKIFSDTEKLAQTINPNFVLSTDWCKRVEDVKGYTDFLSLTHKILRAEIELSFFNKDHHEDTLSEKNMLNHHLSCLLAELIGDIYSVRLPLEGHSDFLGDFTVEQITTISKEIEEKGYYIWPELLPKQMIDRLLDALQDKRYKNRITGKEIIGGQAAESNAKYNGTWWVENASELSARMPFQDIAMDPAILAVAQTFLGTTPIHVQTNSWWSFPAPVSANTKKKIDRLENKNAQRFHQDQEFVTFLKVFIYLSDVAENNGPHVYVEGSANDYEDKLPSKVSSDRRTDEDIYKAFGKERVKSITGKKGQVAFVNTRGFHRGSSVVNGHRLLLQLEYASSLYFNPVNSFDVTSLSAAHKLLHEKIPRIFLNYRHPDKVNRKSSVSFVRQLRQKLSYLRGRIEELIV